MLFQKNGCLNPTLGISGIGPGNHYFVTSVPDYSNSNMPSELGKFALDSHEITNYKGLQPKL